MLNYAEVLNYDRHRALGHRIDQINQYFGENKGFYFESLNIRVGV